VGTLEEVGLATLITVPISILTALFLDEASRPDPAPSARILRQLASVMRMVIDAMNGIPSIITALFVYLVWVEPHGVNGYSGAAAAAALSIMMVPTVTRSAEESLRIVPGSLREASLALGAPQWRTMLRVVLPTARSGLIGGAILGVARGVGETAPTLFTAHGNPMFNDNPFHGAQGNLALDIYELAFSPATNAFREAWGASIVLMLVVGLLFFITRLIGSGRAARRSRPTRRRASQRRNQLTLGGR
jgi:phosphate transport system permease protein